MYLFLQAFAVYDARRAEPVPMPPPHVHWYQIPAFYAVITIDLVAGFIGSHDEATVVAVGKTWHTANLFETGAIMGLFAMMPFAFAVAGFVALALREKPAG